MHITYYLHCDCGHGQPVHQDLDKELLVQCPTCFHVNSKIASQKTVFIVCNMCEHKEPVPLGSDFYKEDEQLTGKVCVNCHQIGFINHLPTDGEYHIQIEDTINEPCDKCNKNNWHLKQSNVQNEEFICPMCTKPLQQRTSATWEEVTTQEDVEQVADEIVESDDSSKGSGYKWIVIGIVGIGISMVALKLLL
ncbi:hypothetical protein bcgnr5372_41040 [Bacillus luti]|nr:hypothetical protein [Bacillus cereus]HDR8327650.1 hypothetical protein [Bacillus cereus]